jgi:hypothetical protein
MVAQAPAQAELRKVPDIYEVKDGELIVRLHPGQVEALTAEERFIVVVAGTQSGKTSFGPFWLVEEIRKRGPGDYLVVTPDFQLLDLKLLPELIRYVDSTLHYGKYYSSPRRQIRINENGETALFGGKQTHSTTIFFGYADRPESLESSTAKAAWCDESGQKKFKLDSWRAILRRLSLAQGRVLHTTTPYNLGWLYQKLYLPWKAGTPGIKVVSFESLMNPAFPRIEWDRAEADLPPWMFDMFYRGRFTRPAGQIYANFRHILGAGHVIQPMEILPDWPRFVGLDFGGTNTTALFYAGVPGTSLMLLYHEYHHGGRTAREHAVEIARYLPDVRKTTFFGGAGSEDQWRNEFSAAGLPVREPKVSDVEVGIQTVFAAHQYDLIKVFDTCIGYLDEKGRYSREVDSLGNVIPGTIEDKHTFHFMDAERYLISSVRPDTRVNEGTSIILSRGGRPMERSQWGEGGPNGRTLIGPGKYMERTPR